MSCRVNNFIHVCFLIVHVHVFVLFFQLGRVMAQVEYMDGVMEIERQGGPLSVSHETL